MIVTPFGSCRIEGIAYSSNLSNEISYTHCTKEIIQLIKYINGDIKLENYYDRFCMRKSIINKIKKISLLCKYFPNYYFHQPMTKTLIIRVCHLYCL